MKIRELFIALIFTVVATSALAVPVELEQLISEAEANPKLLSVAEQIVVAETKVAQMTALPDPELSLAFSSYPLDSLRTDRSPMTGNEIRLAQKFPFPGKLKLKGEIAEKQKEWFAAAYEEERLNIRRQVKDAWYRLLFQRQAIELTNRNLKLLDDFIRLTETRYAVGQGLQQNVLHAHLRRSVQLDKLLVLTQQETTTLAELNTLADRPTESLLATSVQLEQSNEHFDFDSLKEQAEQNRPLFTAYDALLEQAIAQKRLAELEYRPDFTLWASYRFRDDSLADGGTDFISAGVSFNLPIRRERRAAAVAEAGSESVLVMRQRDNFKNQVGLEVYRAITSFNQASELADLYRSGIIPQADQTFQAALTAYQVNKAGFSEPLDALMTLYRYQIEHVRALSDQQRSLAALEAATAQRFD